MTPEGRGEVKALTGLRGVAASYVMLYHFTNSDRGGAIASYLRHGYLAVDCFFVLSGFVLAMTYGARFTERWPAGEYGRFLVARLGRIYPLFIVATLLGAVLALATTSGRTLLANVLLVQAWGFAPSINAPAWSISTEWAAYLVFPVLVWVVLAKRHAWPFALVAAGAGLFALASGAAIQLEERHGPLDFYAPGSVWPLVRCLASFTLGLVAYRVRAFAPAVTAHPAFGSALALGLLAMLAWRASDVAVVFLLVPFLVALKAGTSVASRFLASPVVYWIGLVSYSVYLVHFPVRLYVQPTVTTLLAHVPHGFTLAALVVAGMTFVLAAATYYGIEKPCRDWSRRLVRRAPRTAGTVVAGPAEA